MITINFDAKQQVIGCVDKCAVQLVLKQCNSLSKWTNIDKYNHMGKFKSEYHQNIMKMSRNFVKRNINDQIQKNNGYKRRNTNKAIDSIEKLRTLK